MTRKQIEQIKKMFLHAPRLQQKGELGVLLRYQASVGILTEARSRSIFLANWLELLIRLKKHLKCMVGNSYGFFMIRNKFKDAADMRILLLLVGLISFTAQADVLSDPQLVAVQFFEHFNEENLEGLEDTTAQPFTYNINGKVTQYKSIVDAINFDGLRASGWAYSGINDNELLVIVEEKLATVSVNFSRYNVQGIAYDTEDVIYQLAKVEGVWKIMTATIAGDITLGE